MWGAMRVVAGKRVSKGKVCKGDEAEEERFIDCACKRHFPFLSLMRRGARVRDFHTTPTAPWREGAAQCRGLTCEWRHCH